MIETTTIKKSLRKALFDYKKERPTLSMRAIAKNAGINRYFLNKLMDESDPSQCLDLNQVLLLCKYITHKESVTDAINASSKDISDVLKQTFSADYENNSKVITNGLFDSVDLTDRYIYFVLVLATYKKGLRKEYVSKIFGEAGVVALNLLLEKKLVVEKNNRIKLVSGTDFTYDFKLMFQRLHDYLSYVSLSMDRIFKKEQHLYLLSEGVTLKALKEIVAIQVEAYKKISTLLADENNCGDIPFFTFGIVDRFLEKIEEDIKDSNCESLK